MSAAHTLTAERLAMAAEKMHSLPASQPARFDARIDAIMQSTGRDRTWCRARAAETWADEYGEYLAAKA
jgi:hypothetical protein